VPTIESATKTDRVLPAKDNWPAKAIWKVTVQTPEGPVDAEIFHPLDASSAPEGEVSLESSQYGMRAKPVRKGGRPPASKDFKADPAKLRSENARSALHAAKDLVVAGKVPLEDMGAKTAQFYSYIQKHSEGE
jgi:hypothetical protein